MAQKKSYTSGDILEAYAKVGVARGKTVLVHSGLGRLFAFENPEPKAVLEAHYGALRELLGPEGTLVVPTGNLDLCNSETPFNPKTTPSARLGQFSEYVRQLEGARRSCHPFMSYSAIGPRSAEITQDVSRHAWGPGTPKARLIDMDALCLSVGLDPRLTCSTVHHVELVMGVPYRYTKEFMHPVERDGEITVEPFYLFVYYLDCNIERGGNVRIFDAFEQQHEVRRAQLGWDEVASYSLADFFQSAVALFKEDIYVWLDQPPKVRPYRK